MTTPNIEELPAPETLAQMAEACETLTSLMLIIPGIDTGAWAKTLREADASMQSQAERIKVLDGLYENATASHEDTMRSAMNAEAERDQARAELAAIRAQEPVAWNHGCNALCADIDLWIDHCPHCGKPRPAAPAPQELNLQVVSAFGQAQEAFEERDTLRAKMVPLEKDAERYRWWCDTGNDILAKDTIGGKPTIDAAIDAAMGITGEPK